MRKINFIVSFVVTGGRWSYAPRKTMERKVRLPKECPSCGGVLKVHTMHCTECATKIEGDYRLPALMQLSEEDQRFICDFVRCSGSIKEMAARMELSYPTVRNRLDDVIATLTAIESEQR